MSKVFTVKEIIEKIESREITHVYDSPDGTALINLDAFKSILLMLDPDNEITGSIGGGNATSFYID